jgi:hypothetical protein
MAEFGGEVCMFSIFLKGLGLFEKYVYWSLQNVAVKESFGPKDQSCESFNEM